MEAFTSIDKTLAGGSLDLINKVLEGIATRLYDIHWIEEEAFEDALGCDGYKLTIVLVDLINEALGEGRTNLRVYVTDDSELKIKSLDS